MDTTVDVDRSLRTRHAKIGTIYSPGGILSEWGEPELQHETAEKIADVLIGSELLPRPKDGEDRILIVSPSANKGINEHVLQQRLGDHYKVISGDIAEVKRLAGNTADPVRLDASFLPFPDESTDVIFDIMGAAWHEAADDLSNADSHGKRIRDLFRRYYKKLTERGIIIVDDDASLNDKGTTGSHIDDAISGGSPMEGFEGPLLIGSGHFQFRVYKKKP